MRKLFDLITPLVLVAGVGVLMVGNGFANLGGENNVLNFFFGVPLIGMALVAHFLIRRMLNRHTIQIWLLEGTLVGLLWFAFYYVW